MQIKDNQRINSWFSTAFIVLIAVIFLLVVYSETKRVVSHFNSASQTEWSGSEEYPFTADDDLKETGKGKGEKRESFLSDLHEDIDKLQSFLKDGASTEFYFQMPFVTLSKLTDKLCWRYSLTTSLYSTKPVGNDGDCVIEDNNGMLYLPIPDDDIDGNIEVVSDYSKKLESEGRNFVFLEIPINALYEDRMSKYPEYYEDYSTELTLNLLEGLEKSGVNVVSMSEDFYKRGLNSEDIFLRTDHHWLPQSALRACYCLSEELNKNCGYSVDSSIFDISNYTVSYSENKAFGSLGRKSTNVYSDPEGLPIIVPNYDSDVTVFLSAKNDTKTGKIQETLFDWDILESTDIYDRRWGFYGYDDQALISIHNNQKEDGKRVLVIRNSFAGAMTPYLCNLAENVDIVYLSYFDGSLETLIEKTNPDTVVLAYTVRFFQYAVGDNGKNFNFN